MTCTDFNLILLLWESTAIPRLSIAYFQSTLTIAPCKQDTQAWRLACATSQKIPKGGKNLRKCGTKNETLRPSG
jgi:hypothetical protein